MIKPRIDNDKNIWYTRLVFNVIGNSNNKYISIHYTSGDPLAPDYHCCLIKYSGSAEIVKCRSVSEFHKAASAEMQRAFYMPIDINISIMSTVTYVIAPDIRVAREIIDSDERLAEIFDLLVQDGNRDMVSNVLMMTGEQDDIIRS